VVASLAVNHANTWVATQTFPNASLTAAELASGAAATNVGTLGGSLSGTLPSPSITVDATLSVGPPLGIALAHANTWTATQTFPNNSLTNAELAQMSAYTVKCNRTGSTANASDCNQPVIVGPTGLPGGTSQGSVLTLADKGASGTGQALFTITRTESDTSVAEMPLVQWTVTHAGGNTQTRDILHAELDVQTAADNEIGWNVLVYAKNVAGNYSNNLFGGTIGVKADNGLSSVALVGLEMDTIALGTVTFKVGLQIVDEAASSGHGTSRDAGIMIGAQAGGAGFNYGLQFGFNASASEINTALIGANPLTLPYGVDFSNVTFTTAAWKGNFWIDGTYGIRAAGILHGGVNCAGAPTAGFTVLGGIVTAC
jgi:hypothetical protein